MNTVAPFCKRCHHAHFTSEACTLGTVVDSRARFTIARAAAIAKREGHAGPHCVMSAALLQEEQLTAALMADFSAEDLGNARSVWPVHDDDGRPVQP